LYHARYGSTVRVALPGVRPAAEASKEEIEQIQNHRADATVRIWRRPIHHHLLHFGTHPGSRRFGFGDLASSPFDAGIASTAF
jgi:hypothetical protein